MIDVKIDKGVSTMTFAGSGLEVAAEICMIIHGLYTQLYHRAGPAVAKGLKEALRVMLAREASPVWDVNLGKNAGHSFFLEGDAAAAMTERFPVAIWREVAAALDKMERKKGTDPDGKDN